MITEDATTLLNKIDTWGRDRNIIGGSNGKDQFPKLIEEIGELASGIAKQRIEMIKDGIGDTIVVLAMIAANEGLTITECLAAAYEEIKDRKGVLLDGIFIKESDEAYQSAVDELHRRNRRA